MKYSYTRFISPFFCLLFFAVVGIAQPEPQKLVSADFDVTLRARGVLRCNGSCGNHNGARLTIFGREAGQAPNPSDRTIIDVDIAFGSSFSVNGEYVWGETYRLGEGTKGRNLQITISADRCESFRRDIALDVREVKRGIFDLDIGNTALTCVN